MAGLTSVILALVSAVPQSDTLICQAGYSDGGRIANIFLTVDGTYTPRSMTLLLNEPDGWSRAEIGLDPTERRLPGLLSHAFFAVRFTRAPVLPLRMNAYADGQLRWSHEIRVPFWPATLDSPATAARADRSGPGTVDYVSRADDGLPVPAPRELRIALLDARGLQVGETRYALPGPQLEGAMATALATVEAHYRARNCYPPPPLID